MHEAVSQKAIFQAHVDEIVKHLDQKSAEVQDQVATAYGFGDLRAIEAKRVELVSHFRAVSQAIAVEDPQPYSQYISRIQLVGVVQSALAGVFAEIPGLQGYGGMNPLWVTTKIEQFAFDVKNFFHQVHEGINGKESLMVSFLRAFKELGTERAGYPQEKPSTIQFGSNDIIALLADWGGDNPAARNVANVVRRSPSKIAVHLGDIYYGGVKTECETFLQLWPFQTNVTHPEIGIPPNTSYALNGNHEMYSGGESYFNVVLPALKQTMPYFCLENEDWRLIGLDTAYDGGRLKAPDQSPAIASQWDWLISILQKKDGKSNIILSHHQPVSAHSKEYGESQGLRDDIATLLATEGVGQDAIFGWFFGHEHRCAIYDDKSTKFNARLIGSGCIPHSVQTEKASDPGCTPASFFNARGEHGTGTAISMYAELRFFGPDLVIVYTDEDSMCWGSETWYRQKGRLSGSGFIPGDGSLPLPHHQPTGDS